MDRRQQPPLTLPMTCHLHVFVLFACRNLHYTPHTSHLILFPYLISPQIDPKWWRFVGELEGERAEEERECYLSGKPLISQDWSSMQITSPNDGLCNQPLDGPISYLHTTLTLRFTPKKKENSRNSGTLTWTQRYDDNKEPHPLATTGPLQTQWVCGKTWKDI